RPDVGSEGIAQLLHHILALHVVAHAPHPRLLPRLPSPQPLRRGAWEVSRESRRLGAGSCVSRESTPGAATLPALASSLASRSSHSAFVARCRRNSGWWVAA